MFNRRLINISILFCFICYGTLLLTGCGPAQVQSQRLIPENIDLAKQNGGTVELRVAGGHSKHAMQMPEISDEMFMSALETAVAQSKLFDEVVKSDTGDYQISANIFNLSAPFWGRAPVSLEIAWQLYRKKDRRLLWKDDILTSDEGFGTSGKESYSKVSAIESAARKNIIMALQRMSELDLTLPAN